MLKAIALVYMSAAIIAGTVAIQSGSEMQSLFAQANALLRVHTFNVKG